MPPSALLAVTCLRVFHKDNRQTFPCASCSFRLKSVIVGFASIRLLFPPRWFFCGGAFVGAFVMIKFLATVILCFTLVVTACSSSNYNSDEVPDVTPENLYNVAKAGMATGDFGLARRYLEAIDSRYPFGSFTSQVQLDLIYVYYKERESDLALAQINRFIRLSPTHPNVDYVYYMKGLTEIQKRSDLLQDYLGLDRSQKDPSFYQQAFNTFRELIRSYPDSIYAADARQRMIFIKEELAKREKAIADYYFEREAYLSAIRHCQNILYSFRNTEQLKPALELMAESYERLNLATPANNTRRVIAESFGGSYRPIASNNISTPIDEDTGLPLTSAAIAVSAQEDKSWIDSLGDWIWGSDEEEQMASTTNTVSTTRYTSRSASVPETEGGASTKDTAGASTASQNAQVPAQATTSDRAEGSWLDSVFDSFNEDAVASSGASGREAARQRAAAETAIRSANNPNADRRAKVSTATASTTNTASEVAQESEQSGGLLDTFFGSFKDDGTVSSSASGLESARQRAAAEAAMKSANDPESAKRAEAEGNSATANAVSSLFNAGKVPANASGRESARNRAAAEAVINSENVATDNTSVNGENIKGSWMEGIEITPANASGRESGRNRAAVESALKTSSSSNNSNSSSNSSDSLSDNEVHNIRFN